MSKPVWTVVVRNKFGRIIARPVFKNKGMAMMYTAEAQFSGLGCELFRNSNHVTLKVNPK